MITVNYKPDRQFFSNNAPPEWQLSFDETQLSLAEFAEWLRRILQMMSYHPDSVAKVFHPDLVDEWGYEPEDSGDEV